MREKVRSKNGIALWIVLMLIAILTMVALIVVSFVRGRVSASNLSTNRLNAIEARHESLIAYQNDNKSGDIWYMYDTDQDTLTDITKTQPSIYYVVDEDGGEEPENWTKSTTMTSNSDTPDTFTLGSKTPRYWIVVLRGTKIKAIYATL